MKLIRRVLALLTRPAEEWLVIARERDDAASLYPRYVIPLAAIPSAAMFAGIALSGGWFLGRSGIVTVVLAAGMTYAITLAIPFFAALALEQLAQRFKSDGSDGRAFRLVVYASTPIWLAGVFYLFVQLWPFVMVGELYAVYLCYLGCGPVTETPVDQRVPVTLVVVIFVLLSNIALRWVAQQAGVPTYGF